MNAVPAQKTKSTAKGAPLLKPGEHVIAAFCGDHNGPTLIAIGGLHGNETGGVTALQNVAEQLRKRSDKFNGRVYFLAGNTRALLAGKRFIDLDLNRCWTRNNLSSSGCAALAKRSEGAEVSELCELLDSILVTSENEVYVLDLHSTSADGVPFATVGDTLRNRAFAQKFPVSILLGIEEQLEGTLLEYLNNAGAVTLGFEGGQHYSQTTHANHEALVWTALQNTGILDLNGELIQHRQRLERSQKIGKVYEIRYRHPVKKSDGFRMEPGFNNFDPIKWGEVIARDREGPITAVESGVLLMPLYQKLGDDGFFIGRRVAPFWLRLSAILRRWRVQEMVTILPGVHRNPNEPETLLVNTHIARLFPLQVFHLLGFRRRRWMGDTLVVSRRRHDVISPFV